MRIEILHGRDPDSSCDLTVWIDGVDVTNRDDVIVDVEDVDPGRGYEAEDWAESAEWAATRPERSDAFKAALAEAYDAYGESKYIAD